MSSRSLEKRTILLVAFAFALLVFIIDSVAGAERQTSGRSATLRCTLRAPA